MSKDAAIEGFTEASFTQTTGASYKGAIFNATSLSVGATIEHQRFGVGEIVSLEGTGENAKATVDFRNAGRKQLLLKFAKFKVI